MDTGEAAASKSSDVFRRIVDRMAEGVVVIQEGKICFANKAAINFVGLSWQELQSKNMWDFVMPADRGLLLSRLKSRLKGGQPPGVNEYRFYNAAGEVRWVEARSVLHEWQGQPAVLTTLTDITARRLAQEALRESEDRHRSLLDSSPDPIVVYDMEGRTTYINSAFSETFGWLPEEVVGRKMPFVPPHEEERTQQAIGRVRQAEKVLVFETRRLTKDGRTLDILLSTSLFVGQQGQPAGNIVILRDITERKRAARALAKSEKTKGAILTASPLGIGLIRNRTLVWANPAMFAMLGYEEDELLAKSARMLYPSQEEYERVGRALYALPRGAGINTVDTTWVRKDGTIFDCQLRLAVIDEGSEEMAGIILSEDISEKKSAARARQRYQQELEEKVSERTAALAAANLELEKEIAERKKAEKEVMEGSEKIKSFAYSIAHDLKNPSIAILGLTRLLAKEYDGVLDEKGKGFCEHIVHATEHVAALIDLINTFISAKELPLQIQEVQVPEILQIVKDELASKLIARGIEWVVADNMPLIRADRISLIRVVRNLADNALKYGGDQLSEIAFGLQETAGHHVLTVSDNGVGFTNDKARKLFVAYQRGEASDQIEGVGLGLAIVKEIAHRHGGKVWATSGKRKGACFHVSFPK
jgi:PAS domain S-box-containing protein